MNTALKTEDLQIGMRVSGDQLSDIYGTWIYLDPESSTKDSARILYFCTDQTRDDDKIRELEDSYKSVSVYYMPSYYQEDAEVYE